MFCPDCGTENSRGQKFCTRCGSNLMAVDRAREIVAEVAQPVAQRPVSSNLILGILALICTVGFIATTVATVAVALDRAHGPLPIFLALAGFGALVVICRQLLKLLHQPAAQSPQPLRPAAYISPALPRTESPSDTNRALGQAAPNYQSVVEDPTLQFDRRGRGQ